ncbi:MAG TPA: response regulator, partial [Methanobacteriaceae archaeon]|nr:response regulator [Methanobacteriaceae archaeon]
AAKILIVEDEGLTAMELQRKLKMAGYDVPTFAFSGKEAIKKAEEIKPDLVLMDIFLKGQIDGIDAAGEIKRKLDVPIIYLTAHGDQKTKERAKSTEPFAYLLKPFDVDILRQNIDQALYEQKVGILGNKKVLENDIPDYDGGVFVTDKTGIIQFVNHESFFITEIDQEQASGKNIIDVFKIKQITNLMEDVSKDLLDPISYFNGQNDPVAAEELSGMAWLETNSGYLKAIKYTIYSLKNEDNNFNGLSIFFKDINLLKELDITLDSIENVCDQFPQETAIFNEQGDLIQANGLFLNFFKAEDIKKFYLNLFDNLGFYRDAANKIKDYDDFKYESQFNPLNLDLSHKFSSKIQNGLYLNLNCNKIPSSSGNSGYLVHINEIDKLSFNEKNGNLNSLKNLNSTSNNAEMEKKADIEEFRIREQQLINENKIALENSNKMINTLENDKVELVSRLEEYKNYSDELKDKLDLQLKLNQSLMDLKEELDQANKSTKENSDKQSAAELRESFKKYERQYKTLFEENKNLRENKSKLKKQANKIKKEYILMEKEFKEQLKVYKSQIATLTKVNNSLRNDYLALEKKALSFKEQSEKKIKQLENDINKDIGK